MKLSKSTLISIKCWSEQEEFLWKRILWMSSESTREALLAWYNHKWGKWQWETFFFVLQVNNFGVCVKRFFLHFFHFQFLSFFLSLAEHYIFRERIDAHCWYFFCRLFRKWGKKSCFMNADFNDLNVMLSCIQHMLPFNVNFIDFVLDYIIEKGNLNIKKWKRKRVKRIKDGNCYRFSSYEKRTERRSWNSFEWKCERGSKMNFVCKKLMNWVFGWFKRILSCW